MKRFLLALVLLLTLSTSAWADTYYCLLFAFDSKPVPMPCMGHVWGTFVQLDNNGNLVEAISVSWEPDKISYIDRTRPGWHSSLKHNLAFATRTKRSIRMWGPFETDKSFYDKAKVQHQSQGKYKFFDCINRKKHQNCIHRLSDIAGPHRTGIYWGWWAASSVHKHYQRQGVIRKTENDVVIRLLGIDKYVVQRMS